MTRALAALMLISAGAAPLRAAPSLRHRLVVNGDVLVVGSSLAHDCGAAPTPPGATALCTGVLDGDSGADAYWRDGAADSTVAATSARSSADLALPAGATVKYARLYWSATLDAASPDLGALLDRPGGFSAPVSADASSTAFTTGPLPILTYVAYQASADVTNLVATHGRGAYRVSDVAGIGLDGALSEISYSGWSLVVIYELPGSPARTVALHDGLDPVTRNTPVSLTIGGFSVPAGGSAQARLGVWALSARSTVAGDALRVNGTALSSPENPADNFFNRTRTTAGVPAPGLVPAFSGVAGSLSGYDLDLVDLGTLIKGGDSSAGVTVSTGDDSFWLGGVVLSVLVSAPPDAGAPPPPPPPPPPPDAAVPADARPDAPRPETGAPGTDVSQAFDPAIADAAAGERPRIVEQVYIDADPPTDLRAVIASAADGPSGRSTGFVIEGSGCQCRVASPGASSGVVPGVIAIGLATVIRRRRRLRGSD